MTGRRRHPRFELVNTEGVIRVLHDVMVRRVGDDEFIAIALEPVLTGETVTMHLAGAQPTAMPMKVVDNQPVIVDGAIRHRLRLVLIGATVAGATGPVDATPRRGRGTE